MPCFDYYDSWDTKNTKQPDWQKRSLSDSGFELLKQLTNINEDSD